MLSSHSETGEAMVVCVLCVMGAVGDDDGAAGEDGAAKQGEIRLETLWLACWRLPCSLQCARVSGELFKCQFKMLSNDVFRIAKTPCILVSKGSLGNSFTWILRNCVTASIAGAARSTAVNFLLGKEELREARPPAEAV